MSREFSKFLPTCCILSALLLHGATPNVLQAQQVSDTLARMQRVYQRLVQASSRTALWPAFRPDTMAYLFVVPGFGNVLVNWGGELPEGYQASAAGPRLAWRSFDALRAASTSTELAGRRVAQVAVSNFNERALAGVAAHEAFHTFAGAMRGPGSLLGESENLMLLPAYPVFDPRNEAELVLEGRLLAAALRATTRETTIARVREFLSVRRARHQRMGSELARFEGIAEINEGLPEYVQLSTQNLIDGRTVRDAPEALLTALQGFADNAGSLRLRFYATGPALVFLLDRVAGTDWKTRFQGQRVYLHDLLADAVGAQTSEASVRAAAEQREQYSRITQQVQASLSGLGAQRRTMADSILSAPGLLLVLSASELGRDFDWCGFDPQNLLHGSSTMMLHTRYLKVCAGGAASAEFFVPVVQENARELRVVIPRAARLTSEGQPVGLQAGQAVELRALRIEARTVNANFARALVQQTGDTLRVVSRI